MPVPAPEGRFLLAPKALGGLAAAACVVCCALPVLIMAGIVGAGAGSCAGSRPGIRR